MSVRMNERIEKVRQTKTNERSVETDKNAGENANDLLPHKYEQTLTEW